MKTVTREIATLKKVNRRCLNAFRFCFGAPDPDAPPMRQRFLPNAAGDRQGPRNGSWLRAGSPASARCCADDGRSLFRLGLCRNDFLFRLPVISIGCGARVGLAKTNCRHGLGIPTVIARRRIRGVRVSVAELVKWYLGGTKKV